MIVLPGFVDKIESGPYDGRVVGHVYDKASPSNLPIVERVFLRRRIDHVLIGSMLSDAAGRYEFRFVDRRFEYYVYSLDRDRLYDMSGHSGIVPDPMP